MLPRVFPLATSTLITRPTRFARPTATGISIHRAMSTSTNLSGIVHFVRPDGQPLSSPAPVSTFADQWPHASTTGKPLETRLFYGPEGVVAFVGLGPEGKDPKGEEAKKERVRKAAALGAAAVKEKLVGRVKGNGGEEKAEVKVDQGWSGHAAAVGATLATFHYTLKTKPNALSKSTSLSITPLPSSGSNPPILPSETARDSLIGLDFSTGLIYGRAQNLARELTEAPANLMTPTMFCERIAHEFEGLENVELFVRDKAWAQEKGMRTFLSVAAGTCEPPKFLEIHYKGAFSSSKGEFKPSIAFVGKGVTFDSGGISLKPGAGMKLMRGDMGGAAAVTSATWAIAKLKIPVDLVVCVPLTENMPSGKATKPGDVITSMMGKTVEVDNTDAEGRLVLADALYYASSTYKPSTIIDAATLTGAMVIALGELFSGVFSTSDSLWDELDKAGKVEGDKVWRMPFEQGYMKWIDGTNADLCNTGGRSAGSCTAAIFLREFVDGLACNAPEESEQEDDTIRYAHIDIAGSMECSKPEEYNTKGMTGRPVRTLIEFVRQQAGPVSK